MLSVRCCARFQWTDEDWNALWNEAKDKRKQMIASQRDKAKPDDSEQLRRRIVKIMADKGVGKAARVCLVYFE